MRCTFKCWNGGKWNDRSRKDFTSEWRSSLRSVKIQTLVRVIHVASSLQLLALYHWLGSLGLIRPLYCEEKCYRSWDSEQWEWLYVVRRFPFTRLHLRWHPSCCQICGIIGHNHNCGNNVQFFYVKRAIYGNEAALLFFWILKWTACRRKWIVKSIRRSTMRVLNQCQSFTWFEKFTIEWKILSSNKGNPKNLFFFFDDCHSKYQNRI